MSRNTAAAGLTTNASLETLHSASHSERELRVPRFYDLNPAPPHSLMETESAYAIYFNMLGIEQKGIGIDVNPDKREVTVLARRERETAKSGFFWIFGVPRDARLSEMTARLQGGVLEITIPKIQLAASA